MIMRKGQISMNTIVYVAIALLVLVFIVSVTTGSFGNLASQFQDITPDELETVKTKCTTMCNTAQNSVVSSGSSAYPNTQYCTSTFNIDANGDGIIDDTLKETSVQCWMEPIYVGCQISFDTATGAADTLNPELDC